MGDLDGRHLLAGVIVAVAVTGLLPLAKVDLARQLHPAGLLALLVLFARDLVFASVQVAWLAIRPGPVPRSAVVGVQLRTSSDLLLTVVTELVTLSRQCRHRGLAVAALLYAHVLDITDPERAAAFRTRVHAVEDRVVRAIGTDDDLRELAEGRP